MVLHFRSIRKLIPNLHKEEMVPFSDEKTGLEKLGDLPVEINLVNSGARSKPRNSHFKGCV